MRKLDIDNEIQRITDFISDYCVRSGIPKLVLGLSGGIDSSLSAALAVRAVGPENVIGLLLPYKNSHPDSAGDALLLSKQLGIKTFTIDISPMVDSYFDVLEKNASMLRRGNYMARIRMTVLYDFSSKLPALVLGTSNRSELLVGYFTQHGDAACALEPIGHLYKTEVWQLARVLGLPDAIINKVPTADLWDGQTDEQELGIKYPELDKILYELTELDIDSKSSDSLSFPRQKYELVEKLMDRSAFKRLPIPVLD